MAKTVGCIKVEVEISRVDSFFAKKSFYKMFFLYILKKIFEHNKRV
jgi:hypothetical protein